MSSIAQKLVHAVKSTQYDAIQNLVRDATSNDIVETAELYTKITHFTADPLTYHSVFEMLWKRLNDTEYHKHVLKGLHLLYHLLTHLPAGSTGRQRLESDCVKRLQSIVQLTKYHTERGSYKGSDVREAAQLVYDYLFPRSRTGSNGHAPAGGAIVIGADQKSAAAAAAAATKQPALNKPKSTEAVGGKPAGKGTAAKAAPPPVAVAAADKKTSTKPRSRRSSGSGPSGIVPPKGGAASTEVDPFSPVKDLDTAHIQKYNLDSALFAAPAPAPLPTAAPHAEADVLDLFFNPSVLTPRTPAKAAVKAALAASSPAPDLIPMSTASPAPKPTAASPVTPAPVASASILPSPGALTASPLGYSLAGAVQLPAIATTGSPADGPSPAGSPHNHAVNRFLSSLLAPGLDSGSAIGSDQPPALTKAASTLTPEQVKQNQRREARRASKKLEAYMAAQTQRERDEQNAARALEARLAAQGVAYQAELAAKRAQQAANGNGHDANGGGRHSFRRHSLPPITSSLVCSVTGCELPPAPDRAYCNDHASLFTATGAMGNGGGIISASLQNELSIYTKYLNSKRVASGPNAVGLADWHALLSCLPDGFMLARLVNGIEADTIDERALNRVDVKSVSSAQQQLKYSENLNLIVNAAKSIGIRIPATVAVSTVAQSHIEPVTQATAQQAAELIWALLKSHALKSVNVKTHPHLAPLFAHTSEDAWQLPGDRVLLRWFQSHVDASIAAKTGVAPSAAPTRKVLNLRDSESYLHLLHRLQTLRAQQNPSAPAPRPLPAALALPDGKSAVPSQELLLARAAEVISAAQSLGVENVCISPSDIVSGAPRANLLFTGLIFEQANKLGIDANWFMEQENKRKLAEQQQLAAAAAVAAAAEEEERQRRLKADAEAAAAAAAALAAAQAAEAARLAREKAAAEEAALIAAAAAAAAAAAERERLAAEQARQEAIARAAAQAAANAAEAAERQRQLDALRAEQLRQQQQLAAQQAAIERARKEAEIAAAALAAENARKKAAADAAAAAAAALKLREEKEAAAKAAAAAAAAAKAAAAANANESRLDRKHSIDSQQVEAAAAAAKAGKHRPSSVALLQAAAAAQSTSSAPPKVILKTPTERNEERCLRMWINSVLAQDDVWVEDLFDDLRDGLVLLKVEQRLWADAMNSGEATAAGAGSSDASLINWKLVETKFTHQTRLKCVSNCNYALELGKNKLKLPGLTLASAGATSTANISGVDIADGGIKPILSVGWQLMRYSLRVMLNRLVRLSVSASGSDVTVKGVERDGDFDAVLLNWANKRVAAWADTHPQQLAGSSVTADALTSFSDKRISDSIFIIQLAAAVAAADAKDGAPEFVNWKDVVTAKACVNSRENQLRNASYALSLSRKLNATIFLLAEDIVEHRAKLIVTLFASLMTVDLSLTTKRNAAAAASQS